MPSKRARFSLVARNALPLGKRKLRAKPSLTRTTSPIWPSLAQRSSRITSMVVSPFVDHCVSSSSQTRRPTPARDAAADVEGGFGKTQDRDRQNRPAEHDGDAVDTGQHDRASR